MSKLSVRRWTGFVLLLAALALGASDGWAKSKKKGKGRKAKANKGEMADTGKGSGYKAPFGMAGCGLGSQVMKEDTKGSQITAATLNATGMQTSAISSTGSSNCQALPEETARMEQEVFIAANLRGLETDVSRGGGDYTFALAQVLGCNGDENYGEFLEVSRANYRDIFSSPDPKVVYSRYLQALRSSGKLVDRCERFYFKT